MKELVKRALTGLVYVLLIVAAVFLDENAFDFLFMAFGLICLYEFKRICRLKGLMVFILYLAIWWLFTYIIQSKAPVFVLLFFTLIVDIGLIFWLFSPSGKINSNIGKLLVSLFYIGGGFIFLSMIPYQNQNFEKLLVIGVFLLIWINDTFAYLTGRTLGRTKLYASVSPKKTVEGAIGGAFFALLAAWFLAVFYPAMSQWQVLLVAFIIVVTGTLGDLIESKFKRAAGIKDSGHILPGHGGLLDRLDSLVFAAPFAFLTIQIINHVS